MLTLSPIRELGEGQRVIRRGLDVLTRGVVGGLAKAKSVVGLKQASA